MCATFDDTLHCNVVRDIVNEYREMPGLCLTARQAGRLWSLEPLRAAELLDSLVDARILVCSPQGVYRRRAHDERGSETLPADPTSLGRRPVGSPTGVV